MVVRCTKKMLDLLGGRSITLSELPPTDDDWYLNLVWIERQKCLLHTHAGTLGGFNWSSQHLVMEVVRDGCWQASAGDSCDAWPSVVAGPAVGRAA